MRWIFYLGHRLSLFFHFATYLMCNLDASPPHVAPSHGDRFDYAEERHMHTNHSIPLS